jgi:hypothetical protein
MLTLSKDCEKEMAKTYVMTSRFRRKNELQERFSQFHLTRPKTQTNLRKNCDLQFNGFENHLNSRN